MNKKRIRFIEIKPDGTIPDCPKNRESESFCTPRNCVLFMSKTDRVVTCRGTSPESKSSEKKTHRIAIVDFYCHGECIKDIRVYEIACDAEIIPELIRKYNKYIEDTSHISTTCWNYTQETFPKRCELMNDILCKELKLDAILDGFDGESVI